MMNPAATAPAGGNTHGMVLGRRGQGKAAQRPMCIAPCGGWMAVLSAGGCAVLG